jgi:uncharacterized protein (UPF0333 family)
MRNKSESGMAHIVLLVLVLAVVAAVILVGVHVMQNQNTGENATSAVPVASGGVSAPAAIKTNADLNSAKASLNQDNVDGDLNPGSLDSDVNSLL